MALVKSGWLQRQSTILRRWKKNWFDLWLDGTLSFYVDQHRHDLEDKIHMRVDCVNIRVGNQCRDIKPPEGKGQDVFIQIICRDSRHINICADSPDDALAWSMALQDARVNMASSDTRISYSAEVYAPPPYSEYTPPQPGFGYDYHRAYCQPQSAGTQMVYGPNGQSFAVGYPYQYPVTYATPGVHHVIFQERRHGDSGDLALGMLAGAATGMALGSLFSVF